MPSQVLCNADSVLGPKLSVPSAFSVVGGSLGLLMMQAPGDFSGDDEDDDWPPWSEEDHAIFPQRTACLQLLDTNISFILENDSSSLAGPR